MQTIEVRNWNGTDDAWLWVETGEGQLVKVKGIRADWWIVTVARGMSDWMTMSWCCHPGTTLYLGNAQDAIAEEKLLQEKLRERRIRWDAEEKATWARIRASA